MDKYLVLYNLPYGECVQVIVEATSFADAEEQVTKGTVIQITKLENYAN